MNTLIDSLKANLNRQRLIDTVVDLVAIPSRTGEAGSVLDHLATQLRGEGFAVERHAAGYPAAPAVSVRLATGRPGKTLQFNGHIDTVHLPFVAPKVDGDLIKGSGAADMKGGIAAAVEALRLLRDSKALTSGSVLLTAHDLHEAPWGFGEQLDQLIRDGLVGDAVLIPEPLHSHLPVAGRGSATWKVRIRRPGPPVHEVMRPADEPSVIAAGADLVRRLQQMNDRLAKKSDALIGSESVFIGQLHSGEIFNQYPQECMLEGTRRWLPTTSREEVDREFRGLLADLAQATRTQVDTEFRFIRDAYYLDQNDPVVPTFQSAVAMAAGQPLPIGAKAFVDDGNSFWGLKKVPAITHGPKAGGQHTVNEWVSIQDLERVALVYALTAVTYCGNKDG